MTTQPPVDVQFGEKRTATTLLTLQILLAQFTLTVHQSIKEELSFLI